jgi:hypothetical protein
MAPAEILFVHFVLVLVILPDGISLELDLEEEKDSWVAGEPGVAQLDSSLEHIAIVARINVQSTGRATTKGAADKDDLEIQWKKYLTSGSRYTQTVHPKSICEAHSAR